jgi:predicted NAD/FAD-dependent oxidoreductase
MIVVGAGLAGLSAARTMALAGHDVTVFDKGRAPGGRMATRRIGAATFDHGAQFFTARSDAFAAMVDDWMASGLVTEWCRGFGAEPDGHPRYAVRGGMNALAKHLAAGLDVRCPMMVFAIRRDANRWAVQIDDGSLHRCDGLVVTCPVPQSYSLLVPAEIAIPEPLLRTDYDRTLALLAVLDGPGAVPEPGGVQGAPGFTFIGDNRRKGISAVPALTLHADPVWSKTHWDADREATHAALLASAKPWLGAARVVESQVKRWRFATPRTIWPEPCWRPEDGSPVVLAGDAFAGPRVEGAILSGVAAARSLLALAA